MTADRNDIASRMLCKIAPIHGSVQALAMINYRIFIVYHGILQCIIVCYGIS